MNDEQVSYSVIEAAGRETETFEFIVGTRSGRMYLAIAARPWRVLLLGVALIVTGAYFLPTLTKDTSAEAFISSDHPAVVYRDHVEEIFGLSDPVIVAVVNEGPDGIFNPKSLSLIDLLTEEVSALSGVDPERVRSLATENNIYGTEDSMLVEPFFEGAVHDQEQADAIREAVMRTPLFLGSMVARDGSATVIIAELLDPEKGGDVFDAIMALREGLPAEGNDIYVAGEGAVAQYLGDYVDADARRVYPIIGLVILTILLVAYRTPRGVALPFFVVIGGVLVSLGTMAGAGVPYYIITSALPVILISIGVADGIHIMGQYYEELALRPYASSKEAVVRAMDVMWHPVLFTSLTDAAGFLALAAASFMPPMRAFGIFAAVGVVASCLFSLAIIPSVLCILKPRPSGSFKNRDETAVRVDRFGKLMARIGRQVVMHPKTIVGFAAVAALAGVIGALQLQIDYQRIDYFHEDEEIYKSDMAINRHLDGTNFLDIVIETPEAEGLIDAERLARIEALQAYAVSLPHVEGTHSIVDIIKQIGRSFNADDEAYYRLPEDNDLLAQYFFLYSITGNPSDLEEEIDYDYRLANVRVTMNSGRYSDIKEVVESLQPYLDEHFSEPGLEATLAGRANITYHWVGDLALSHFLGVGMALLAVWATASLTYRSAVAGLYAVTPVMLSTLAIYAVMGATGIWLGVGTSMFAAIGIGISVNFAIHTMDRTLELVRDYRQDLNAALLVMYPATGRALMFNFVCVFFGFGVLMTSQVPPLNKFGLMVAVGVLIAFIASVTVLPAMLLLFKPRFLRSRDVTTEKLVVEDW